MVPEDTTPKRSIQDEIEDDLRRIQKEAYKRFLEGPPKVAPKPKPPVLAQPMPSEADEATSPTEDEDFLDDELETPFDDEDELYEDLDALFDDEDPPSEQAPSTPAEAPSDQAVVSVFSGVSLGRNLSHYDALMPRNWLPRSLGKHDKSVPKMDMPGIVQPLVLKPTKPSEERDTESPSQYPAQASEPALAADDTAHEDFFYEAGYERTLGRNDLVSISYFLRGYKSAQSVCRIVIRNQNGIIGYGTGFLVAPDIMMTNNHVIPNEERATLSVAEFDFQYDENNSLCESHIFKFNTEKFFLTDRKLDFTLVALHPKTNRGKKLTDFPHIQLFAHDEVIYTGDCVSIIQHPKGNDKSVALRENEVKHVHPDHLHYLTDTEPGSSGSPVFNDHWEAVALHHSGIPDPVKKGAWVANEGVKISSIAAFVKEAYVQSKDRKQRKIMKGIFQW